MSDSRLRRLGLVLKMDRKGSVDDSILKRLEERGGKKEEKKKKAVAAPLVIISPLFGETFGRNKNGRRVYLAVTFSNIRLDI